MLNAMVQEDERGLGNWHAEWETMPEIFRLTGGALHQLAVTVPLLEIDTGRMRRNIEATHGLIFAEGIVMALTNQIGKAAAQAIVETAVRQARTSGEHLRDVLAATKEASERLTSADLDRLFAPENYLGAAEEFTDRIINATHSNR